MPKMVMLELTPRDMMTAIITLSEMMISLKEFPNLIKAVPNNAEALGLTVLTEVVRKREREEGKTADQDKIEEEQLEQSVQAFQDLMAKAQSK